MKKKIFIVFGTRPEFLKLYNLIKLIKNDNKYVLRVINTSQHSDLLTSHLKKLKVKIDYTNKQKKYNNMGDSSLHIGTFINKLIAIEKPNLVIYQGDTLTAYLSSFYSNLLNVPSMHVEAGLRTYDYDNPWPEEGFRNSIKNFSTYHCAPTKISYNNLVNEKINTKYIKLTGNTIVDLLEYVIKKFSIKLNFKNIYDNYIYITIHRRENFGKNLLNFCEILTKLSQKYQHLNFIIPVHSNPNIKNIIYDKLSLINNIHLIEPLNYIENLKFIYNSLFVISDSGGIQEEVASLNKKILIYRKITERPEILQSYGKLVNQKNLIREFEIALNSNNINKVKNPFGDGNASKKIYFFVNNVV